MNSKGKISIQAKVLMILVLPLVINYFTYFAFTSNYTKNIFSEQSFKDQFDHHIYKYRILSRELLLITYDLIKSADLKVPQKETIKYLDPNGDVQFYASFFILSGIFLCSFAFVLILMLESSELNSLSKLAVYLSIILLISISQFTLVPYDVPGYFFNILGFYFSWRYLRDSSKSYLITLVLCILIGTLNRETMALNIAFHFSLIMIKTNNIIESIKQSWIPLITFLFVYVFLRLMIESEESVVGFFSFLVNIKNFENLMGLTFMISIIYLLVSFSSSQIKQYIKWFLIASSPFLFIIIFNGILYEIRLIIPIILGILSFQILMSVKSADN